MCSGVCERCACVRLCVRVCRHMCALKKRQKKEKNGSGAGVKVAGGGSERLIIEIDGGRETQAAAS